MRSRIPVVALAVLGLPLALRAQAPALAWGPAPPVFPAGAKIAVLQGDPSQAAFFTVRLELPDGYRVAPHFHPTDEYLTVISGTLNLGTGDKLEEAKAKPLSAGSIAIMQPKTNHFGWTKEETVVQVHGIGPWGVTYVNPSDDPRKK